MNDLILYAERRRQLERAGTPYTEVISGSNVTLYIGNVKVDTYDRNGLSVKELAFIQAVRRHILKLEPLPYSRIYYTKLNVISTQKHYGYVELDLNSAYWVAAHQSGSLTDELYEQGLKQSKLVRLIALGSLARTKTTYEFDGQEVKIVNTEYDADAASHFWSAAFKVDSLLLELQNYTGAIFYWVDAFFVRRDFVDYVKAQLDKAGFEFSIVPLRYIEVIRTDTENKAITVDYSQNQKTYFFKKPNTKKVKKINAKRTIGIINKSMNLNLDIKNFEL